MNEVELFFEDDEWGVEEVKIVGKIYENQNHSKYKLNENKIENNNTNKNCDNKYYYDKANNEIKKSDEITFKKDKSSKNESKISSNEEIKKYINITLKNENNNGTTKNPMETENKTLKKTESSNYFKENENNIKSNKIAIDDYEEEEEEIENEEENYEYEEGKKEEDCSNGDYLKLSYDKNKEESTLIDPTVTQTIEKTKK